MSTIALIYLLAVEVDTVVNRLSVDFCYIFHATLSEIIGFVPLKLFTRAQPATLALISKRGEPLCQVNYTYRWL